ESVGIKAGRLRTLESTGIVPQDVVVEMPRTKEADRKRLKEVLIAFDPEKHFGQKIVGKTQRMEAFLPATDEAYNDLREAIASESQKPYRSVGSPSYCSGIMLVILGTTSLAKSSTSSESSFPSVASRRSMWMARS